MDYSLLVGLHFRDDNTGDKMGLSPFLLRTGNKDSFQNEKFMRGCRFLEAELQDMDRVLSGRGVLAVICRCWWSWDGYWVGLVVIVWFTCKSNDEICGHRSLNAGKGRASVDTERSTKRAKNQVQGLCMVLCNRVVGQNQEAIDVVAEAMLKSILAPHDLPHRPTTSLLFLGLTRVGQADLVRSVAENFICDDGTDLLIQIDLSKYRDLDSLFQLIHGPLELPFSHSQHGVPLLEIVQMKPHSILLFSQVEMAHISVFSALLSVLDQGTLSNVDGHTVDFRHTVVIFASNVGNRRLLAHLVGHASQDGASHEVIQQVESSVSAPTDGQNTRGLTMAQAPSDMVGHLSHFHTKL